MRRWVATTLALLVTGLGLGLAACGGVEGCPDVPEYTEGDCAFAHGKQNH